MAHELDFSKGKAAIAYRGATPWHGLGETIGEDDTLDDIQHKAGLEYDVKRSIVQYERSLIDVDGNASEILRSDGTSHVLYRSDTGDALSIVSPKYQIVQPREIVEFYRDLVDTWGFKLEVVGALKGGRKVWALANTTQSLQLRDHDNVKGYLLLATSYDGTMATKARFTSIRVVCNNTLTLADNQGKADVTVPHNTKFDAKKVKLDLKIGEAWEQFSEAAKEMSSRIVSRDETMRMLLDVYYGLTTNDEIREFQSDERKAKAAEKFMARMTTALFEAPGAQMASARGTLWGVLNAITYDVDFQAPSRTPDGRLDKAWFGAGEQIKNRALERAKAMVA